MDYNKEHYKGYVEKNSDDDCYWEKLYSEQKENPENLLLNQ